MNNREEWSQTEQEMQKMLDNIRKEYPDFWAEEPKLPKSCKNGKKLYDAEKSRRHRRRATIAACLTACVLGSTALTIFVNSETAHAMKFALEKKYYELSGMAIVATNPNQVSEENSIAVTIINENEIEDYKKFWNGVVTLAYVPDGYQFKKLEVTKYVSGMALADYRYEKEDGTSFTVAIRSADKEENIMIWTTSERVKNGECEYRIWEDEIAETKGIDVLFPDKVVMTCGKFDENELIDIVNGMN